MAARLALPDFRPGTVWLVGAGPGDPGLLTLHALHALEHADVVLHDALVAPEILSLVDPGTRLEPVGKRAGRSSAQQLRINQRLIDLARRGQRVVRLKGGDPFVFGRGGEEALALAAAGVPFRVVPGVSAGMAAPAYAGIPVTHRMTARSVAFVTGHAVGDTDGAIDWQALAAGADTLVLFMALGRLAEIAAALLAAGRNPDEPVALVAASTTAEPAVLITTLADAPGAAAAMDRDLPTLIVVGPTVDLHRTLTPWLESTPAGLSHLPDGLAVPHPNVVEL